MVGSWLCEVHRQGGREEEEREERQEGRREREGEEEGGEEVGKYFQCLKESSAYQEQGEQLGQSC